MFLVLGEFRKLAQLTVIGKEFTLWEMLKRRLFTG